jgi:hypothetical protein
MRTNAPTRLQSPNDNSHPCARDLDLAWQVLGTVARGPLPIKKKRIKKKRIGLSRAPGPYSEYLEEFPLGFYWSSIRARAHRSAQFALVEIGELGVGGPIYL